MYTHALMQRPGSLQTFKPHDAESAWGCPRFACKNAPAPSGPWTAKNPPERILHVHLRLGERTGVQRRGNGVRKRLSTRRLGLPRERQAASRARQGAKEARRQTLWITPPAPDHLTKKMGDAAAPLAEALRAQQPGPAKRRRTWAARRRAPAGPSSCRRSPSPRRSCSRRTGREKQPSSGRCRARRFTTRCGSGRPFRLFSS